MDKRKTYISRVRTEVPNTDTECPAEYVYRDDTLAKAMKRVQRLIAEVPGNAPRPVDSDAFGKRGLVTDAVVYEATPKWIFELTAAQRKALFLEEEEEQRAYDLKRAKEMVAYWRAKAKALRKNRRTDGV